ncbi:MAG: LysM peptidoglycan-binding domain-containing protein [Caldilineaceae bacterium SB0675_bin_29]|uniref:LysM peptidoglycan-binding domain-containing protein n=1 Tax=Caldilineaceae bacterium SB0675_bin_29 TaxID=2605266 RepID=A0A6B1G205_9CHLR|nr:LysM peptidoglycan-binding domain-containing protein [Caldilineaceae bacterium SB0675_bin_29]
MRRSDRKPGWYGRLRGAGRRVSLLSRAVLLGALVVAGFTVYHLSRDGSTADQAVALAQQGGEENAATATPEATPDSERQAVTGSNQSSVQGRSDAAAPVADAGFVRPYTVESALDYVYTARMGERWSVIADRFDLAVGQLKEANSELWLLRGEAIRAGDQLAIPGLGTDAAVQPVIYEVQAGDTWERIAGRFSVTYLDLLLDNFNLWALRGVEIQAGDEIEIRHLPVEVRNVGASRGWAGGPPVLASSFVAAREERGGPQTTADQAGTYLVQPGDTWESVAEDTGINVEALKEVNGEYSEGALQSGDVLRISWILHVALMFRQVEGNGVRSASELSTLSEEERAALAARGLTVYKEQYCGVCHQLESAGTRGIFGPTHGEMVEMAAARLEDPAYSGEATDVYTYLYESIIEPDKYFVKGYAMSPHRMPSFRHIPEEDLEALIVFLAGE